MTTPTVDIDQLRRQFPEEVVRYFDAVVAAKFQQVDWRIAAIEQTLTTLEDTINNAAISAANQAEARFVQQALTDLVDELKPYIRTVVEEWVYDERTHTKFKFYVDSQANIDELEEKDPHLLYIGTETWEDDDLSNFVRPDDRPLSTDV